jgi:hypothetical protein
VANRAIATVKSQLRSFRFSDQTIILIIDQGRHGRSVVNPMGFGSYLSEKGTTRNSQALALAGVKGPSKPFDPKGRAFPFGSPVKGSCPFFQKLRSPSFCKRKKTASRRLHRRVPGPCDGASSTLPCYTAPDTPAVLWQPMMIYKSIEHVETSHASGFLRSIRVPNCDLTRSKESASLLLRVQTMQVADAVIVTAAEGEDDAVRAVRDGAVTDWTNKSGPGAFSVWSCVFSNLSGQQSLKVVLARAHEQRVEATATMATALLDEYRPRCLAMCGVCAGRPEWTELGDVIIPSHLRTTTWRRVLP